MSKIVLTTNDESVAQKVKDFGKLLGVEVEVKGESATVLPFVNVAPATTSLVTLEQMEAEAITKAITAHKGNLSEVAKTLNIGRATLYRKVKQYNINTKESRNKKVA